MATTTTTTTTFEDVRACRVPWCMSHLEPVETRHIVGDGWFSDDNDTRLARLHQHHGEHFDLAMVETFLDGEHEVEAPAIDNRHKLDLSPAESLEAAAELQRLANLANA